MNLEIKNLSKTYPNGVRALKGINLSIGQGMFGLLGANGAGKTSFMNVLATLIEPDAGEVTLGDINVLKNKLAMRSCLGYLPQEFGVYPSTSAVDMLDYIASLKGMHDKAMRQRHINELLDLVNLSDVKNRSVENYSGGMKRRFGVAQALIGKPDIVIVDEPTAGLDPSERNRFQDILSRIGEHTIIILSTHIIEDVSNICSAMAVMHEGEVVAKGSPAELVAALKGRLWQKTIDRNEIANFQGKTQILTTKVQGDGVTITLLSDKKPSEGFTVKQPDLEDVYFTASPDLFLNTAQNGDGV